MASAINVANELLKLAKRNKRPITNMQIQKLVYIAHGMSLGYLGIPLLDEHVEAWKYGPVIPDLYYKFSEYGQWPIDLDRAINDDLYLTKEQRDMIASSYINFGDFDGWQLSELTHMDETPWSITWERNGGERVPIPNCIIEAHYKKIKETGVANCL